MATDPARPYCSVDLSTFSVAQREAFDILASWRKDGLEGGAAVDELFGDRPQQVRKELQREAVEWTSDTTLHRYLAARNFSPEPALSLLKGTLKWRATTISRTLVPPGAPHLVCEACTADPLAHCFILVGWDSSRRPIAYGSQPRMKQTSPEGTVFHCMRFLELAWNHPASSGQFTYVVDFRGFGIREATQARLALTWASMFANHLPERLGSLVLVNPPGVFDIFYRAGKALADSRTLDKIKIVRGSTPAEAAAKLAEFGVVEPGTVWWLERAFGSDPWTKDKEKLRAGTLPRLPVLTDADCAELGLVDPEGKPLDSEAIAVAVAGTDSDKIRQGEGDEDATLGRSRTPTLPAKEKLDTLRETRGIHDLATARRLYEIQMVKNAPWVG
ncbi:hypothetical protein DFJ74DRAFT_297258 [Hyaloraphidium curvatum]|nr:hypothetical protein DFJ74DRAFT_297258 [Hyaloraphidium curvatum]